MLNQWWNWDPLNSVFSPQPHYHVWSLNTRRGASYILTRWGSTPLHFFVRSPFGRAPAQSRSTWIARDSVNCRYLMAFLCAGVEKLLEVCAHSIAWLELGMKTQRHCFQWSNPLYSNSTAFLSHIPKPPLLCEGFFFLLRKRKKEKEGYTFLSGSLCWPFPPTKAPPPSYYSFNAE